MNGNNYLLDTNIVLYIANGNEDLRTFLDRQRLSISVITEMELLSFPTITRKEIAVLSNFIAEMEVVPIGSNVKKTAILIRRKYKLKLPDSIIAATAIVYDIPLITADKQFRNIEELQMLLYDTDQKRP
ncbi:type II toxin-antitoxin system VapC family toxin [Nemorincola caseinilytica]